MRNHIFILAFFALINSPVFAEQESKQDRWMQDINHVQNTLYSVHAEPFHQISKEDYDAQFEALRGALSELSDLEIFVRLFRLVSLAHDGHTVLAPIGETPQFSSWYPVRFVKLSDGVFIEAIDSTHKELIGTRVISYEGKPIEDVWAEAGRNWILDNPFSTDFRAGYIMVSAQFAVGAGISDDISSVTIEIESQTGERKTVDLDSFEQDFQWEWYPTGVSVRSDSKKITSILDTVDRSEPYFRHRDEIYWFENMRRERIFYVKVDAMHNSGDFGYPWVAESPYARFEEFNEALWRAFDRSHAQRLVIDLRDNFGGNTLLFQFFIKEASKRSQLYQRGNLIVVTGNRTFSASAIAANVLKKSLGAVIVGTPHGNGTFINGDIAPSFLPNSGALLMTSMMHWDTELYPWTRNRIVMPDIPVYYNSNDYFSGHDTALDAVKLLKDRGDPLSRIEAMYAAGGIEVVKNNWADMDAQFPDRGWWTKEQSILDFGLLLEERNDDEGAMAIYHLAAKEYPDSANAAIILARQYIDSFDFENAPFWVARSLELAPTNSLAQRMGAAFGMSQH